MPTTFLIYTARCIKSNYRYSKGLTDEETKYVEEIKGHIQERPAIFLQMEAFLPRKNG